MESEFLQVGGSALPIAQAGFMRKSRMQKHWRGGVKVIKLDENDSSGDERAALPRRMGIRGGGFGGGAAGGGGGTGVGVGNDVTMIGRGSDGENSDEDTEDARSSDEVGLYE